MIDSSLLEILSCPRCKGDLEFFAREERLQCVDCGYSYGFSGGIPVLLPESGTPPAEPAEAEAD